MSHTFINLFSATASAQLPQSTSQVTRGALTLNPNEAAVQSVGKLSERIKEYEKRHHHLVVCCDHCSNFCPSFSGILFVIIAHTFIFFSYGICTASTVNQPGHCNKRSTGPQPKTSLLQHNFPWAMSRRLQSSGSEVVRKEPN